ncbi:NifB/NifX family molybdenum-iron cluster-binding protein [Caldivirga sp. UBA161]|uniref:NifB/NifX family molybdenum-iron cluster-binding protein n=1 Tax=Caldivirga sp. UBA161 TaxID=1915569 RepID=UPI0025BF9D6F|nr:NifB/NifX family molybdenum-iron cluster-binding protein [Caldivirga sp. UBA161]
MKLAVIVDSEGHITGPGEGEYILIYEVDGDAVRLVGREPNPALQAEMHRGLYALRRVRELGADSLIVSEIGRPGFNLAKSIKLKVYIVPDGVNADDAVKMVISGKVNAANAPTHEHGHDEHELESM